MKNKLLVAALLASTTAAIVIPASASANQELNSTHLSSSTDYSLYWNNWNKDTFMLNNQIIHTGFGLSPYYQDREYANAKFFIKDYNYTTFEAFVGVRDEKRLGDLGTSTLNIYADNTLIYSKNFTNQTNPEKIAVAIPANTTHLDFRVSTDKGNQGKHAIIVGNPTLTNALRATDAVNVASLVNIGASTSTDYSYYTTYWSSEETFKLGDKLVNKGMGFSPYYSDYEHVSAYFNISDYKFTTLETTLGIDASTASGDRGSTTVSMYADGMPIYTKTLTNQSQPEDLKIAIPNNTTWLKIVTSHSKGTQGKHKIVLDNPLLTNYLPATPEIKGQNLVELEATNDFGRENGYYSYNWGRDNVFNDASGQPFSDSVGLRPYYSSDTTARVNYYISDYNYSIFDTTFTLDSQWLTGDYGSTNVTVLADGKSIGSVTLNSKSPTKNFIGKVPKGTKNLEIKANFAGGTAGKHGVIAKHPILRDGFTDIPVSHSYFDEVNYLVDKNIINGYSDQTFKPSNTLTRGHAAMLIARALDLSPASSMKFQDVEKSYNGYSEIAATVNAGLFDDIINGSKFEQSKPLTRGEMADIVAKAFNLNSTSSKVFTDTKTYWAKNSIGALYDNQITTGYEDNTFRPNNTLTRGHFSLFIARAMNEAFR